MKKKKKVGRPTTYKPEYCQMIIDFFGPPYYTIKDICITVTDNTGTKETEKTEMEALPPVFLSDFAKSIGVSILSYRSLFNDWAKRQPDFAYALKEAKELEYDRIRVNASMGLYAQAFSIFTMKNIAGWRDKSEITGAEGTPLIPKPEPKVDYERITTDELVATLQEQIRRTA